MSGLADRDDLGEINSTWSPKGVAVDFSQQLGMTVLSFSPGLPGFYGEM